MKHGLNTDQIEVIQKPPLLPFFPSSFFLFFFFPSVFHPCRIRGPVSFVSGWSRKRLRELSLVPFSARRAYVFRQTAIQPLARSQPNSQG